MGNRQVAAHLGLAEGTARGWLRAFAGRAEAVRRHFTVALVALADDPVMPDAGPPAFADAVSVVAAAHRAAATKWPHMLTVSRWEFAGRAIGGRVLTSPSIAIRSTRAAPRRDRRVPEVLIASAGMRRALFETRGGLPMSPTEDEDRRRAERARQVGLFRYGLIQDLMTRSSRHASVGSSPANWPRKSTPTRSVGRSK